MEFSTQFKRNVETLSQNERKAVARLIENANKVETRSRKAILAGITELVDAAANSARKRTWNRHAEANRSLVGVRLNSDTVAAYRSVALASDRSLYRFTLDALTAEYERTKKRLKRAAQEEGKPPAAAD